MTEKSTTVHVGDSSFDIAGVGDWLVHNIGFFVLLAAVAFIFFLFQKGGFAEKLLDYRLRRKELETRQLDDAKVIADMLNRRYERDDPLLPFDDAVKGRKP